MSNNWNGIGCPEAGQRVFISKLCSDDSRVKDFVCKEVLVESTFHSNNKFCITISHPVIGLGALVFDGEWVKPIKSDRDKAIEEMLSHMQSGWTKDIAGELYDAGYRKQSEE